MYHYSLHPSCIYDCTRVHLSTFCSIGCGLVHNIIVNKFSVRMRIAIFAEKVSLGVTHPLSASAKSSPLLSALEELPVSVHTY